MILSRKKVNEGENEKLTSVASKLPNFLYQQNKMEVVHLLFLRSWRQICILCYRTRSIKTFTKIVLQSLHSSAAKNKKCSSASRFWIKLSAEYELGRLGFIGQMQQQQKQLAADRRNSIKTTTTTALQPTGRSHTILQSI